MVFSRNWRWSHNRSFTEVYKMLSPSRKQLTKNITREQENSSSKTLLKLLDDLYTIFISLNITREQENTWSKTLLKLLDGLYTIFISLFFVKQSYFVFELNCLFTNWVLRKLVFIQTFVYESQEWLSVGFLVIEVVLESNKH